MNLYQELVSDVVLFRSQLDDVCRIVGATKASRFNMMPFDITGELAMPRAFHKSVVDGLVIHMAPLVGFEPTSTLSSHVQLTLSCFVGRRSTEALKLGAHGRTRTDIIFRLKEARLPIASHGRIGVHGRICTSDLLPSNNLARLGVGAALAAELHAH